MRTLSLIFVIALTFFVTSATTAQTPLNKQAFEDGAHLARNARYAEALEIYRKALLYSENQKTDANSLARLHFNIGVCLYHSRQTEAAVKEFNRAIALGKDNYQKAFYALGMAETELKNYRQAEAAFRSAVNLKKDDGEAWFDLGLILLEEKDFAAAREAFQKAIKYKSAAAADAHNNLGVILALEGDFAAAEKAFQAALRKSSGKSVEAQNNLRFCALYKQNSVQSSPSKLEFSRPNSAKGE